LEAAGTGPDPEAAYFQSVEEFFVSRRGDPLFLSNADWTLVRQWRKQGIPLRIVLRGIADALDSHAHSWGRTRKVTSLAYCKGEVEAARERWERALALGTEEGADLPGFLAGLADALSRASGLGSAARDLARATADSLRERAASDPSPREVEPWLAAREQELIAALRRDDTGRAAGLEAEVERDLAPYAGRMPDKVLRHVREESLRRRLLEAHGLPRLSLFHL
jgi:hypothetical protein